MGVDLSFDDCLCHYFGALLLCALLALGAGKEVWLLLDLKPAESGCTGRCLVDSVDKS